MNRKCTGLVVAAALSVVSTSWADDPAVAVPVAPVPTSTTSTVQAERVVAVLDLRSDEATANIARALTAVVSAEVAATPGYRAVSRNDLRAVLAHQTDVQMTGCDEVKCMADVAKLVAADLILSGAIEKVDSAYVFSLDLIDPIAARVIEKQVGTWRDDPERLVELARPFVDKLMAGTQGQRFLGSLEVIAPEGATLVLDGKNLGVAPLPNKVADLATGAHQIEVSKDGYVTASHSLAIVRGETTLVRVDLVDEDSLVPWYARWWVWGSAGGGLALVGGAAAAVLVYNSLNQPPEPTTLDVAAELPVQ